ncbi:MAG: DUF6249 domain-containing protein [Bacteroidales bacterium]|jgi:heme/copper-type cytochrome/quinol oxidase subunit 2|nr:DUF6249 domain-containing protein [Bacteroidales bacterium]MCI2122118.1 DUF6249 domain-containing protein [Bacteroidales bacterium]MCI2145629.1 DUF6249 domain-containing protein [Bacteroidales bacterium]
MSDVIVPVFVCFLLPVCILFIVFYFKSRNEKARLDLINTAIERGVEINPDLIAPAKESKPRKSNPYAMLTWGICLVLFGLATFLLIYFLVRNANGSFDGAQALSGHAFGIACTGFIPMFIGIGLIISFYMGRHYAKADKLEEAEENRTATGNKTE